MNSNQLAQTIGDRLKSALKNTPGQTTDGTMNIDINFNPAPLICQPGRIAVNARQIGQAIIFSLPLALIDPSGKWGQEAIEADLDQFADILARRLTLPATPNPQPKRNAPVTPALPMWRDRTVQ